MEFAIVYGGYQTKRDGTHVRSYTRVACGVATARVAPRSHMRQCVSTGPLDPKCGQSLHEIHAYVFMNPDASVDITPFEGPHLWFRQMHDAIHWLRQHGYMRIEDYIAQQADRGGS